MQKDLKPIEIFTALDLEMAQPSEKIIQIGACIGNISTGEIIEKLSVIVNPNEQLSDFIIGLTGITQEQVDNGVSLEEAYLKFKEMHVRNGSHPMLIQWGGGDEWKLKSDLFQAGMNKEHWVFGRTTMNVKNVYQSYCLANGIKMQSGLAKSMTKLGLKFSGRKHNAEDDSINTLKIFMELLKKLNKCTQN